MKTLVGPITLSLCFFALVLLSSAYLPPGTRHEAEKWLTHISGETNAVLQIADPAAAEPLKKRLQEQASALSGRAAFHKDVMLYFYSNYYVGILLASVCGGVAALGLLLISKTGWQSANPYVISLFVSASACTAFYVAYPGMFKQEENVAKNKSLYLRYLNLLNETRTFAATGLGPEGRTNTLIGFIGYLDLEMRKANDVAVSFDPGKYPTYKNLQTDKNQ
jgi:mevalonate pyrophosphate decarboxylase